MGRNVMKIQETKIVETDNDTFVELVISDNEDIDQAREYLVLHVRLPPEVNVSRFAAIQKAALQTARDV